MPTPDRTPGPEFVEKLVFENEGHTADNPGELVYNFSTGSWELRDATGVFDPRTGGSPPAADPAYRRHFLLMGA